MKLSSPFMISSRLCPALKIGDCTISLEVCGRTEEGRTRYLVYFDFDKGKEILEKGLKSGCGGQSTQQAFESLLGFLGAAAEAYRYNMGGQGES